MNSLNKPLFVVDDVPLSPEEYAALWGSDPWYDNPPRERGDGYMFYNFGSDKHKKDNQWYLSFAEAIGRTMRGFLNNPEKDIEDLTRLREWVVLLANET